MFLELLDQLIQISLYWAAPPLFQGLLEMSGDIFGCHNWRGAAGI